MSARAARAWGFWALGLATGLLLSRFTWWHPPGWAWMVVGVIGGLLLMGPATERDREKEEGTETAP